MNRPYDSHQTAGVQGWRYGELVLVLLLAAATVVFGNVPLVAQISYPFQLLGTFVHELSHGVAAIITGGEFQRFAVSPNLSGLAWSAGGIRWVVTSAGYLGSALFGGFLLILTARGISARHILTLLGLVLGMLCLVFVRNLFGIISGLALTGVLLLAGEVLNRSWAYALLLFLSVQLILDALNSVFYLVFLSARLGNALSDAHTMQQLTGIPALFWALFWSALSIVVLLVSLTIAFRGPASYRGL